MKPVLLLIPVISAVAGWLFARLIIWSFFRPYKPVKIAGISLQGFIPASQKKMAASLSADLCKELLNSSIIREKLAGPETLQKALPVIEEHIDHFLKVKLKASLPVITMFIGERVTNQLRELFMKELEQLFPSVMNSFIDGLQSSREMETEITLKIERIPPEVIENIFCSKFKKELTNTRLTFAVAGFITGIIQVIIVWAIEQVS